MIGEVGGDLSEERPRAADQGAVGEPQGVEAQIEFESNIDANLKSVCRTIVSDAHSSCRFKHGVS